MEPCSSRVGMRISQWQWLMSAFDSPNFSDPKSNATGALASFRAMSLPPSSSRRSGCSSTCGGAAASASGVSPAAVDDPTCRPSLVLNARSDTCDFYARHGFVAHGEECMEAGIRHRRMERPVQERS